MIKRAIPFIALLLLFSMLCGCTQGVTKPDGPGPADTSAFLYPDGADGLSIVAANSFSDGAAWITTKNSAGKYKTTLINTSGKALYATEETDGKDDYIGTNFRQGVSLLKNTKTGVVSIITSSGERVWSTDIEGIGEGKGIFGDGIKTCDAYYFVNEKKPVFERIKAGAYFNGYTVVCYDGELYGVINPDGSWLLDPVKLDVYSFEFSSDQPYAAFRYNDQSNFFAFSFESGELVDLGRNGSGVSGIIYPQDSGVTLNWKVRNEPHFDKNEKAFLKTSGEKLIDLSKYSLIGTAQGVYDYAPEFRDGICVLTAVDGGKAGVVVINSKGEELFTADHPYRDDGGVRTHCYAFSDGEGFIMYAGHDKEYYQFCGTEGAVYFRLDGTTGDFLKSYKTVYPFADGAALVFDGEEYFYVNRSGGKMFS